MRRLECPHESDVLSAVYTNRWPNRVSDELRDHVFDCRLCADIVAVASAFEEETDLARAQAPVPDAAIVWWRAQLRARQAAAKEAVRPITVAQAIGFAAAVGVAGAIFGATATWFQATLRWMWGGLSGVATLPSLPAWPSLSLPDGLAALVATSGTLLGSVVLFVALASLAVYVAVRATETDTSL
jgi:hypothetical protein